MALGGGFDGDLMKLDEKALNLVALIKLFKSTMGKDVSENLMLIVGLFICLTTCIT